MGKTFWGVVSAAVEQSRREANMAAQEDGNSSHALSFINTNARSLGPKIESLIDCMEEKATDVAFITETWYQSNRDTSEEVEQYAARFSYGLLSRNRQTHAPNGRQ